jgi:hypothetical protein
MPVNRLEPDGGQGPLLEIVGVRRAFGGVRAVEDATFTVAAGAVPTTPIRFLGSFWPGSGAAPSLQNRVASSRPNQIDATM